MRKIVYLPLDERPCNYDFPGDLFAGDDVCIVTPDKAMMPHKRDVADSDRLKRWLLKETADADGTIIAVDTLIYGGLVPSRIHELREETIESRMEFLRELKEKRSDIPMYAFQIIMRCPNDNGADEEPLYYKKEGRAIHLNGLYKHKAKKDMLSKEEEKHWKNLTITKANLKDFESRRKKNLAFDLKAIDYAKQGTFDFLILCQDDSGEYGYPAMDQEVINEKIKEENVRMKVHAYAGADELGLIMLSRMLNTLEGKTPKIYVKYPSATTPTVIPCLEDRYLDTTIRHQIISSGGILATSVSEADFILVALMGAKNMYRVVKKDARDIDVLANLTETFEFIRHHNDDVPVSIADLLYLNAGSIDVLEYIKECRLTNKLAGYAGWNTSSNALGTSIAMGIAYLHHGMTHVHKTFLFKRYVEDIGYCNIVRDDVTDNLPDDMNYFDVKTQTGQAAGMVKEGLQTFIGTYLDDQGVGIELDHVRLPWARMFEVGFDLTLR